MTVSSTTTSVSYSGNGSTTAFAVTFPFFEITVEEISSAGVVTAKTSGTHYTVTGGSGSTGTVTMLAAPASGVTLRIRRTTTRTQLVDYSEGDGFPAETHEKALDRLTMIMQEMGASSYYNPTLGALSGSFGSGNATFGRYARIGDLVFFYAEFTISDIGTAAGYFSLSLPVDSSQLFFCRGRNMTQFYELEGQQLSASTMAVYVPTTSGSPCAEGETVAINGFYFAA